MTPFEFGAYAAQNEFQKSAAKPAGGVAGAALGALSNMGKPAVKAVGNAVPARPSPAAMPVMGRTVLPAQAKPGTRLTHKQFGAGRIANINDGVATVEFPGGASRQYRVRANTAPPKPTAQPIPASQSASVPDRIFSAARTYGNATGVLPTSIGGVAMAGINPVLQNTVAPAVDDAYGTNFSGRNSSRTDLSSRVGQFMFPTQRAWNAAANTPILNGVSPRQFGERALQNTINALPGGR